MLLPRLHRECSMIPVIQVLEETRRYQLPRWTRANAALMGQIVRRLVQRVDEPGRSLEVWICGTPSAPARTLEFYLCPNYKFCAFQNLREPKTTLCFYLLKSWQRIMFIPPETLPDYLHSLVLHPQTLSCSLPSLVALAQIKWKEPPELLH